MYGARFTLSYRGTESAVRENLILGYKCFKGPIVINLCKEIGFITYIEAERKEKVL